MTKFPKAQILFSAVFLLILPHLVSAATLFSENFEDANYSARGWYDNTTQGTIATSGCYSGNCLQWAWSSGATKPTNGASSRKAFTPTDTLYVSFYVKFQTGWRGSQKTYHPHMMYILSDLDPEYSALADNYLDTYLEFISDVGGSYAIRPTFALQDNLRVNQSQGTPPNNLTAVTENRSVNYCNTPVSSGASGSCFDQTGAGDWYSANLWRNSTSSLSVNAWHHVEVYLKMNTMSGGKGQSNGVLKEWVDGTQVFNYTDVLFRTNQDATKKWAQFVLAPYIGDGSPITQTMWIDELTVGTSDPYAASDKTPPAPPTGLNLR